MTGKIRNVCINYPLILISFSLSFFSGILIEKVHSESYCACQVEGYTVFIRLYDGGFVPLEWLQITKSVLWNFAVIPILSYLNNLKDLDLSYKIDLGLWDCFERKKLRLITEEIRYSNKPLHKHTLQSIDIPPCFCFHFHKSTLTVIGSLEDSFQRANFLWEQILSFNSSPPPLSKVTG